MKQVFIYALLDPTTGNVRYVGKSINPMARLRDHLKTAKKEANHRACWIRSLSAQGLKPQIEILDEVSPVEWPSWEVAYILFFREQGCDLVNGTPGGEAPPLLLGERHPNFGKKFSPEYRKKLSAAQKGRTGDKSPSFGKKFSPARCEKMRLSALRGEASPYFGKKRPREVGEKISATKRARFLLKNAAKEALCE